MNFKLYNVDGQKIKKLYNINKYFSWDLQNISSFRFIPSIFVGITNNKRFINTNPQKIKVNTEESYFIGFKILFLPDNNDTNAINLYILPYFNIFCLVKKIHSLYINKSGDIYIDFNKYQKIFVSNNEYYRQKNNLIKIKLNYSKDIISSYINNCIEFKYNIISRNKLSVKLRLFEINDNDELEFEIGYCSYIINIHPEPLQQPIINLYDKFNYLSVSIPPQCTIKMKSYFDPNLEYVNLYVNDNNNNVISLDSRDKRYNIPKILNNNKNIFKLDNTSCKFIH